MFKRFFYY